MDYSLLPVFTILNLVLVATHAAVSPELYWKSVLPSTPMPKPITHILPDWVEEKSTTLDVGKGGVSVNAGKGKPRRTSVNVGKGGGTNVNVGGKGGGVSVNTGHKGKPVTVRVKPHSPFLYNYAATETQLHDDPRVAFFFLEKDLHPGTKFNLDFTKSKRPTTLLLPRQVANTIPFSSEKLGDLLNKFSVKPGSKKAEIMKNTIEECEEKVIDIGEQKYCATSLESMVDFSISKLGKNIDVVSTVVDKETYKLQKYTMAPSVKKLAGDKVIVCHKQNYPYAVFYCHKTKTTNVFLVPLEGANGVRVKAIAVCHTDTSKWNPDHLAFHILKIKPGTLSLCHFLPEDHLVWLPKNN